MMKVRRKVNSQEWVAKFYRYYNNHSLPVKHLNRIEELLTEYANNDPKGFRRLVKFLRGTEQVNEIEKMESGIRTKHDISQKATDLLIAYCAIYLEELPCMLMDIIDKPEGKTTMEVCISLNEDWKAMLNWWGVKKRIYLYIIVDKDEQEEAFLKERLELNDVLIDNFNLNIEKEMEGFIEEVNSGKKNEKALSRTVFTGEPEKLLLEVKILTYICRKSSARVKEVLFKYGVSRGWMTLKIREWKKDKLIQIKNKPLTLVRTNRLRNHLDTYIIPNKKGIPSDSEGVIVLANRLDEIVRNEGRFFVLK